MYPVRGYAAPANAEYLWATGAGRLRRVGLVRTGGVGCGTQLSHLCPVERVWCVWVGLGAGPSCHICVPSKVTPVTPPTAAREVSCDALYSGIAGTLYVADDLTA